MAKAISMTAARFARKEVQPEAAPIQASAFGCIAEHQDRTTRLTREVKYTKPADEAHAQAKKLHSLIFLISGGGQEHFDSCCESIRDNVLWLLSDLSTEVVALTDLASKAASESGEARHE